MPAGDRSLEKKLSPRDVDKIKKAHANGASFSYLSKLYRVSASSISKIVRGEILK